MLLRYTVQRVAQMVPTVVFITMIVFGLIHLLPGDPVMVMLGYSGETGGGVFSQEVYDATKKRLGLDQPIHVQYLQWLGRVVRGDLGNSLQSGTPVAEMILQRYPATLQLAGAALLLSALIALPLGVLAAVRHNTPVDYAITSFSIVGICVPNFWIGLIMVLVFSLSLRWLPAIGYVPPTESFTGFLRTLAMPMTVLALFTAARIVRFLRSDVLEQLHQDYVRTARAKGIPGRRILWRHVLKNSLITTATVAAFEVVNLLGGSTVIEIVFSWPGVSYLLLQSIFARDYPVLQGVVLCLALTVVWVNFAVDILYRAIDPRIQLT